MDEKIGELQLQIEAAVEIKDYETAAKLQKQVKMLEKEKGGQVSKVKKMDYKLAQMDREKMAVEKANLWKCPYGAVRSVSNN